MGVTGRCMRIIRAFLPLALFALLALPAAANARDLTIEAATGERGDGTMSAVGATGDERRCVDPGGRRPRKGAGEPAAAPWRPATLTRPAVVEALAPTAARSWEGIFNTGSAPSDSTGAVGTTRYVETINRNVRDLQQDQQHPDPHQDAERVVGPGRRRRTASTRR